MASKPLYVYFVFVLKSTVEAGHTAQEQRIDPILNVLEQVESIATQTPPIDNKASRFGNPAFRTFHDEVEKVNHSLHHHPRTRDDNKSSKLLPSTPNLACLRLRPPNCRCISSTRGVTANASITEAGWNSISYAGCELCCYTLCVFRVLTEGSSRYCLRQLGIVDERDHKSLVIRVFWRLVHIIISNCSMLSFVKVRTGHASPPVNILARTCGVSWCMGTRRLPFPAVLVWFGAVEDSCWTYRQTCSWTPLTQGDSRS